MSRRTKLHTYDPVTIIRLPKVEKYFTAANALFSDARLSWEARGVMGYLLSKPDNWKVRLYDLVRNGPAGAHKIGRVLRELQQAGYMTRKRISRRDGKFDWLTTVYETPGINPQAAEFSTRRTEIPFPPPEISASKRSTARRSSGDG